MSVVAVIPARYGSTRFPAKALAAQTGKFLVQHVYEQSRQASLVDEVIVATDDERIVEAVKSFEGQVRMTRPDHPSGTDRVGEVAERLGLGDGDIVLNVQGDEPEVSPDSLDRLIERMTGPPTQPVRRGGVGAVIQSNKDHGRGGTVLPKVEQWVSPESTISPVIGTLAAPFGAGGPCEGPGSPLDPNCVKVVLDQGGNALYFSRSPIPYPRATGGRVEDPSRWLLHLGVYAFHAPALRAITGGSLPVGDLERAESLEQLRWLSHGYRIAVVVVDERMVGIDTPEDYAAFVARWRAREKGAAPVV